MEKELLKLLDDPRTGLKDSSDTNKTRYAILELFTKQEEKILKQLETIDIKMGDEVAEQKARFAIKAVVNHIRKYNNL